MTSLRTMASLVVVPVFLLAGVGCVGTPSEQDAADEQEIGTSVDTPEGTAESRAALQEDQESTGEAAEAWRSSGGHALGRGCGCGCSGRSGCTAGGCGSHRCVGCTCGCSSHAGRPSGAGACGAGGCGAHGCRP